MKKKIKAAAKEALTFMVANLAVSAVLFFLFAGGFVVAEILLLKHGIKIHCPPVGGAIIVVSAERLHQLEAGRPIEIRWEDCIPTPKFTR